MKFSRTLLLTLFAFLALLFVVLTPGSAQAAAAHCEGEASITVSDALHENVGHASVQTDQAASCCAEDESACKDCSAVHCATSCGSFALVEPPQLRRPQTPPTRQQFARSALHFPAAPLACLERPPKRV